MSDDPNRITNLVMTLKDWEGVSFKVGDVEIKVTLAPGLRNKQSRLYFAAPKHVAIKRIEKDAGDFYED